MGRVTLVPVGAGVRVGGATVALAEYRRRGGV